MENDKDIKIEPDEEVGLEDKIKTQARGLGKKIEEHDKDTGTEYEVEKANERIVDWFIYDNDSIIINNSSTSKSNIYCNYIYLPTVTISSFAQSEGTNQTMKNISQESNQTLKENGQSANQTGEAIQQNTSDFGANISEGAKSL